MLKVFIFINMNLIFKIKFSINRIYKVKIYYNTNFNMIKAYNKMYKIKISRFKMKILYKMLV